MKHCTRFLIPITLFILTSCSTLPHSLDQPVAWSKRSASLTQLTHFTLKGVIGISTPHDRVSATLNWQQIDRSHYHIYLFGPLGTHALQLTGKKQTVTLTLSTGKKIVAISAEALLAEQTGYQLPVTQLFYWVRGLPSPTTIAHKQFDHAQHLCTMQQSGWLVHYSEYANINGMDLPIRLILEKDGFKIKIIIKDWQIAY
jgi:outer membrane lipoprotein LolB